MTDKEFNSFYNPVITVQKPRDGRDGDMYYDTTKGIICARINGQWKEITNKVEDRWPEQLKETLGKL
jgi:hypothetical protein